MVEAHERIHPSGAIEVRPLVAHAQMHLDHTAADGLGVEDAGIAREVPANPRAAVVLDLGVVRGVDGPIVESAFPAGTAGDMAPPARLALDDGDVRADMAGREKGDPHTRG